MPLEQTSFSFPDRNKGYFCPCCSLFVKVYCRSFNHNMAAALLILYTFGKGEYVKMEDLILKHGIKRCGDFSYLRFYGLIEKMLGERADKSGRNGYYKITGRGMMFCENKLTVKEKFYIFNNRVEGFTDKDINIHDALNNKFNYNELMNQTN